MRKRIQKKREVLREGYIQGLKKAQRIINEMLDSDLNAEETVFEFNPDDYEKSGAAEEYSWYEWCDETWETILANRDEFFNKRFVGIKFDTEEAGSICLTTIKKELEKEWDNDFMAQAVETEFVLRAKYTPEGALCFSWENRSNGMHGEWYLIGVDEDKMYDYCGVNKRGEKVYGEEIISEDDIMDALVAYANGEPISPEIKKCLFSLKEIENYEV